MFNPIKFLFYFARFFCFRPPFSFLGLFFIGFCSFFLPAQADDQQTLLSTLPPEAEKDEPAVFDPDQGKGRSRRVLEESKVEDQKAVLMDQDKPDYIPLFFDPERNGIVYAHQEIEYDLTQPLILRLGSLSVTASGVAMRMTRETGEFFDFDFALDLKKRYANMYMISFQWPTELIPEGAIELLNDQGVVLWRREVKEEESIDWKHFVSAEDTGNLNLHQYDAKEKSSSNIFSHVFKVHVRQGYNRLKLTGHDLSSFGLFGREIFEIPVWKITEPFRFCVTHDTSEGRIAVCSKRYHFLRKGGQYWVLAENKVVEPQVMVNDRPVTLKGSAVFVDHKKTVKFAALMSNGTYFEFVSYPKKIKIVDMVLNEKTQQVEVIGFGSPPLGPVVRIERRAKDVLDFLNFAPTIGDFRKFWKATFPLGGSLFLRGHGGAPFKQPFVFEKLPRKNLRPRIHIRSPSSTYASTVTLRGETAVPTPISSSQLSAVNTQPNEFKWEFLAKTPGKMNTAEVLVKDGSTQYRAYHEIYRGYPGEISTRLSGVLTNTLEVVVLGELAGQWWFEKILGWDHPTFSLQRWGLNGKYFKTVAGFGGNSNGQSIIKLEVKTLDLKYRLSPGIWGRDPTLGLMANMQYVTIEQYQAQMGGVGAFWARSMPKFFDDLFNIIPFMRYPKWVDVEGIFYFLPMLSRNRLGLNSAINFHGKVMWTPQFFGEGGFGFKLFQFDDLVEQKAIGLAMAYGTVGLGYSF